MPTQVRSRFTHSDSVTQLGTELLYGEDADGGAY